MIIRGLLLGTIIYFLAGCSRVYLHNGAISQDEPPAERKEIYHITYLTLKEVSAPVDLTKRCKEGRWQTVKIQRDALDSLLAFPPLNLYYAPWHVAVSCEEGYYSEWPLPKTPRRPLRRVKESK